MISWSSWSWLQGAWWEELKWVLQQVSGHVWWCWLREWSSDDSVVPVCSVCLFGGPWRSWFVNRKKGREAVIDLYNIFAYIKNSEFSQQKVALLGLFFFVVDTQCLKASTCSTTFPSVVETVCGLPGFWALIDERSERVHLSHQGRAVHIREECHVLHIAGYIVCVNREWSRRSNTALWGPYVQNSVSGFIIVAACDVRNLWSI